MLRWTMDITDLSILRCLRNNSRASLGQIADELGVSKATVSRRLSRLEEEGYVSGYHMNTNYAKLGLMRAQLGLQVSGTAVTTVIEELRQFPEIASAMKTFGDHSLICSVYTSSVDSLYELIQTHVLKIPYIENVEVDIIIDSVILNPHAELDLYQRKLNRF